MAKPTEEEVLAVLKKVIDPETGINIVKMGFIHNVKSELDGITVSMALSCPGCPLGQTIVGEVKKKLKDKFRSKSVRVKLIHES